MGDVTIEGWRLGMVVHEHDRMLNRSETPFDWRANHAEGLYEALVLLGVQRYQIGPTVADLDDQEAA